jgi:hypothetical protein
MREILRLPPPWLNKALQGLTFWVGHRCSIYSDWQLSEGALVGELCNLIHAHLGDNYSLRCEQPHARFLPTKVKHADIGDKARVDLSVWKLVTNSEGKKTLQPKYAIEVKRATATKGKIDEDLRRLAAIVEAQSGIRAILCVVSERRLPKRFVSARGYRKTGLVPIDKTASSYQVIGVVKASAYLKIENLDRAHYCCAIEVFSNDYIEEELRDEED